MKKLILVGALFAAGSSEAGAVCYVNSHAAAGGSGASWSSAFTDIEQALSTPACLEIHVAAGVYTPSLSGPQSFFVAPGVKLIGGYVGGSVGTSRDPDERDPWKNLTVLSGDLGNDDANASTTSIDQTAADVRGTNSTHVLVLDGKSQPITNSTAIDGFIITGGNAWLGGSLFENNAGGGLLCLGNAFGGKCNPSLQNLVFTGNRAGSGGAVANLASAGESSPIISHCRFHGNSANTGGAMLNEGGLEFEEGFGGIASPTITDTTFDSNEADFGGAIYNIAISEAMPFIQNTTFADNSAKWGAVIYNDGSRGGTAGAYLVNVTSSANTNQGTSAFENYGTGGFSQLLAINSILWDSESGTEIVDVDADSEFDHSVMREGCPATASWCSAVLYDDPQLGALQDNGGNLPTMMPAASSDAVDNGIDKPAICPSTDERGIARRQMLHCDIGAVERRLAEALLLKVKAPGRFDPPRTQNP